ncbi:MAG: hypothetical protein MUF36_08370 [Bacteroidales bacterium]|jgi:hypothetical protein|nr:hypothetical protein [Bacteroidales bacterium]
MKSPFKFFDSYTREDRAIFFGRDQEITGLKSGNIVCNLFQVPKERHVSARDLSRASNQPIPMSSEGTICKKTN